jgi:glucose-1-phosphate thymidylyltransferase
VKCLILAGGFATRLYPLTEHRAKALLEYKGKPVINHIIDRIPANIDILVATNKRFEADFVKWREALPRHVEICVEEARSEEQKIGAVGAIEYWTRMKAIEEDLLVIAGDNYFEFDPKDMISMFNRKNTLIAVHDVGDKNKACEEAKACQLGLAILEGTRLIRLDEKPPEPTSSIIATGIYILPSSVFSLVTEYCRRKGRDNLGDFINFLLGKQEVHAYSFASIWVDIGDEIKRGRLSI